MACFGAERASAQAPTELIAEIRVHGNHTTPDTDVLGLAGLAVGEPATPARLAEAEARLRGSGRFEAIEVRRRSRSIADPTEVLVILLVDERAGVSKDNLVPGPLSRLGYAAMWLPVLHHRDGYGVTYGARASFVNPLGATSRMSTPFTWGGERRAALEVERSFEGHWITSLRGAASISRRVNPHVEEPDTRREVSVQAERAVTPWLRAGARAGLARVAFAGRDARRSMGGVHLVADTRVDPSFPRNAVQAEVAWERLGLSGEALAGPPARDPPHVPHPNAAAASGTPRGPGAAEQVSRPGAAERIRRVDAGRWTADVRGFLGIGGSAVLALRGQAVYAGSPLPDFEKALLGGADSVRGYRTGHRAGDRVSAFSAEVRLPLTSPLSAGRVGIKAFVDAGTAWAADARLADQRFDRGMGGGVYVGATAVTANLDVAWPARGKPRVHAAVGFRF